ncbi:MAG: ABC transporter permease [Acidimicrobiia bacterium]
MTRRVADRRDLSSRERLAWSTFGIAVVLVVWELAERLGWVETLVASSPSKIVESLIDMYDRGVLVPAIRSSAKLFGLGFGIALLIGITVGALMGWYRRFNAVIDPWISLVYASPRIAFVPLVLVWAGIGLKAQVVLVVLIAVFPMIINTAAGIGAVDRDHLRVARSFLATNVDVLRTIALPGALPTIIAGVRQGMIQALLGTVAAEYFIGNTGVGGLIFTAGLTLQTGQAFAGALVFAGAALGLTMLLRNVERRFDRWRP